MTMGVLDGRTALVTGAGRGIGAAITSRGGKAFADTTDVTDFAACAELIDRAAQTLGGLDVVINAAGILRDGMVFKMGEQDWDAVISVHLKGTFNMTRHAAAWWRENRGGQYRLINFTSMSGLQGAPS